MALASGAFVGLLALAVRGAPRPGRPSARAHLALDRVDCAGRAQSPRRVRFLAELPARNRATILGDAPRVAPAPPRQRLSPSPHGASALTLAPARVAKVPAHAAAWRDGRLSCPSLASASLRPRFRNLGGTAAEQTLERARQPVERLRRDLGGSAATPPTARAAPCVTRRGSLPEGINFARPNDRAAVAELLAPS